MKYTKKVPYFKKGDKVKKRAEVGNTGKTKEAILAEARRNQAIEKKAQAADAEKAKTANNVSKPKTDLSTKTIAKQPLAQTFGRSLTEIQRAPVKQSLDELSFGEAALRSGDTAVVNSNVGSGVLRSAQPQSETPTITPDNAQKTNVTNTTGNEVTKIRDTSSYSGPSILIDRERVRNIPQNFRNSGEAAQQFFDGVNLMYEDFGKTTPGKIMNNPTQSQHLLGALPLIL